MPDDARFCHKCGKPQFEPPGPDPEETPLETVRAELAAAPPPPEVGFHNPRAIRIGMLVAVLCLFATVLSGPAAILSVCWLIGGGFFSVYLYRRQTGELLSLRAGARIGWMTGLFAFIITLVLFTTGVLVMSDPNMAAKLVEEMRAQGADANVQSVVDALRSPAGVLLIVVALFVNLTLFPTIGGAIGAKLLAGRSRG